MQKIIDISWPISAEMTAYKDKKTVKFESVKHFEQDNVRESTITLGSHTGTHIDAPAHFLRDGATIDKLNLTSVVGTCRVLDLTNVTQKITAADLHSHDVQSGDIILLKTKNSELSATQKFTPDFIYLEISAAEYVVEKKVMAVGVDYLGIEHSQPGHVTHKMLMNNNITIIEGLRLEHVNAGTYFLVCLPLNIIGLEAAPARAVLIQE